MLGMAEADTEWQRRNLALFSRVAEGYGRLGYLAYAARVLAAKAETGGVRRAADVGSGTGEVALALAQRMEGGEVVGFDFSPDMVRVARERGADTPGLRWEVADAAALPLPDGWADLLCSSATLVFLPDMPGALREWRRVLQPGGAVLVSSFAPGMLGPLPGLWVSDCARLGLRPAGPPLGRVPSAAALHVLLREAGFEQVRVRLESLPYRYASPEQRLAEIEAGLEGACLAELCAAQRQELLDMHRRHLQLLFAAGPLTLPVTLLSGSAKRGSV